jgi:hypothetical protein
MLLPKYEEIPMKCFRLTFPQKTYDVFIQDEYDTSSCVNITDEQGDQVPFNEWDNILMFLNIKNNVGVQ